MLVLVIAGVVAPFLHADRYRGRIEAALSDALARKVSIADVRLDLFTGPGFEVSNVIVAETDPRAEPFAYVGVVRAVPRFWSIWTGHLEFSSLTLEDAHVNLKRSMAPDRTPVWNFEPLLRPRLLAAFPSIRLRDARVNFQNGDEKSVFYLLNTDLDVYPRAPDGSDWEVRFTGEPARTDRPAHGSGAIAAQGRWKQTPGSGGHIELDARLDRSEIGDIVALLNGRDAGVHGLISGRVHVAGPPEATGIEGEVRVSELHGWDQSPPSGGVFTFRMSGTANASTQRLELFAEPRSQTDTLTAHIVASQFLQNPMWTLDVRSEDLPVAGLPSLLRNFGARIPDEPKLSGSLQGDLHYAAPYGWKGVGTVSNAVLSIPGLPPMQFDRATLELAGPSARLLAVSVVSGTEAIGTVAGTYSLQDGSYEIDLSTSRGPVPDLLKVFPIEPVPLLSGLSSAKWTGDLRFTQGVAAQGVWTGSGQLTDGVAHLPEISEPVQIRHAQVRIDGNAVQMDNMALRAGDMEASAEYRYVPLAQRPHQFRLVLHSAKANDLETLFQPVLRHRSNLIDLALTMGRETMPPWLSALHADGTVQVDSFDFSGAALSRVRWRVQWDGPEIAFSDCQSHVGKAALSGRLNIDVRDSSPQYTATAKLANFAWQGGKIDGEVHLKTAGSGADMLTNLNLDGTFIARELLMEPLGIVQTLEGNAQVSWDGTAPRFVFPNLKMISDGETWTGNGISQGAGGAVRLQLSSNGKQMNLAGSLTDPAQNWVAQ